MIHVYHKKIGDFWCAAALEDEKIWATAFTKSDKEGVNQILNSLPYNRPFQTADELSRQAEKVLKAIAALLAGENVSADFSFECSHLSKYAQKILLGCLAKVPVGYVTTYGALAKTAGGGPRAVGQIMASNPFAPLVPCHRVIKSDFSIGGFGGGHGSGVKVKRAMLQREDRGFTKPSQIKTEFGILKLFPVGFLKK